MCLKFVKVRYGKCIAVIDGVNGMFPIITQSGFQS